MTATTTSNPKAQIASVIDAMRSVQSESDRWILAEELRTLIPSGAKGFGQIIDEASKAGVVGKLSAHTLRLYRDTAARWPEAARIPGVSFSAHREAMVMIGSDGSTKRAEKLLKDLAKGGADKVTVASVRKAAAIQQGKPPTQSTRGSASTSTKPFDALADLLAGAPQLIASINAVDPAQLDKLHDSLTKAITRVEQLRAKKAAAAKKAAGKSPATTTTAKAKPTTKASTNGKPKAGAGDLRGL